METFLTKTMTIVALICFLVVGAAATAILGRDSVPAALHWFASLLPPTPASVQAPVSNKENKKDRLAVVSYALAAYEPPQATAALSEPLRQAYASTAPADIGLPKEVAAPAVAAAVSRRRSPRPPPSRQPQKNYALLSDVQIAGIKDRLKLSASQESYWPPVETALRAVARKIHAGRQANPECGRRADRSRICRSPAIEIGGDAAAVPVARRPEERSPLARPHHRPGKSRLDDLSGRSAAIAAPPVPRCLTPSVPEHRPMPRVARVDEGAEPCGHRRPILQAWEP